MALLEVSGLRTNFTVDEGSRRTVGQILAEPLALHGLHPGRHRERVAELLHTVGLAPEHGAWASRVHSGWSRG